MKHINKKITIVLFDLKYFFIFVLAQHKGFKILQAVGMGMIVIEMTLTLVKQFSCIPTIS